MVVMKTPDGSASDVLEMNFFDGIILPRATPAWSGVMHSMSSMPRQSSHSVACFQSLTPREFCRNAGVRARPPFARAIFLSFNIHHQNMLVPPVYAFSNGQANRHSGQAIGVN